MSLYSHEPLFLKIFLYIIMKTFKEFQQISANITGTTATTLISQLDPTMKAQWEKIIADFPKLFAFLNEIRQISKGSWKITPAQFTSTLNKHITGASRSLGVAQTAPLATR